MLIVAMVETSLREFLERTIHRDPAKIPHDFSTRLMFQKILYLAQEARLLQSPRLDFNLYFHGPYSPDWARIGYAAGHGQGPRLDVDGDLSKLDPLLEVGDDGSWLAAIATLHWYVIHLGLSREGAQALGAAKGKHSLLERFDDAWAALEGVQWLR